MAISKKLINLLEKNKIRYEVLKHKIVYTAYDKAATLKIPQKIVGKTLVVKLGKNPVLVLISANKNLDKQKLKKLTKARNIEFIKEAWMKKNLKDVKVGAIPPFGNLWKLPTFVDRGLVKNKKIIISAGDYNYSIKINPALFKKIMGPAKVGGRRAGWSPDLVIGNFSKAKK